MVQLGEVFKLEEAIYPVESFAPARIIAWDVEPRWFDKVSKACTSYDIYERVLTGDARFGCS